MVTFDPAALRTRLDELEQELAQPDFWNDQQRAARLSAEHQRTQEKLRRYDELVSNVEFLREGVGTFPDEELEPVLRDVRGELARLQEDALFSGEYDAGDAVVTIHAGTGGTDAKQSRVNISRPPKRSARAPVTIRPSEPTSTGVATSSAFWPEDRPNCSV